jgi:RNA-directed DNA polymerase
VTDTTSADTERNTDVPDWRNTIIELARSDPKLRFTTLAHRLTPDHLLDAYRRLKRKAAPGPDGVTVTEYGEDLEARVEHLHQQLRSGRYRASPVRRVYIPKPNGKLRPLGIANVEDRLVQTAITMVLEPIYEQDFLDFSYGFRPGRSAKDALEALRRTIDRRPVRVVFEADIRGFFDNLVHDWLRKFLGHRIADRGIHRLIGKVLNSGVVEEGQVTRSKRGAPQGGPLSPLLANVYLHYVLDLWFDRRFRPTCEGEASMVRYADDFVVCFEHRHEAERFATAVGERFAAFGLELVPEKTRLIEFGTSQRKQGPGPKSEAPTFDFLGFTHYMRQRGRGLRTARKPSMKSRTRFLAEAKQWLRQQMHQPVRLHQKVLSVKLRGYYQYFGLRHCEPALRHVLWHMQRLWYRILLRRSQKAKRGLTWWQVKRKPWFELPTPRLRRRTKRAQPVAPYSAQLGLFPEAATPAR